MRIVTLARIAESMGLQTQLVAQFRQPSGTLGRLAGWTMANRPSNQLRNSLTIELLGLKPNDLVLEIGYGPGLAIEFTSREIRTGKVIGLDHSTVMHRQAAIRNAAAIAAGKVEIGIGDVLEPPFPLPLVDKIYSVNVVQFWPEPERVFAELRRLLKPGGCIATTFMPRVGKNKLRLAHSRADALEQMMEKIGFEQRETHWMALHPTPAFCVLART